MQNHNYILIPGWAVNELKLKGNNLMIFSIIYGFSQDGETEFTGSIQYLCECLGVSRPTVINSLKYLVDKNLIEKREESVNGVVFNRYRISLRGVKNLYGGSKESLRGGGKESLHNNTNNKNTNNKQVTSTTSPSRRSLISHSKKSTSKDKVTRFIEECNHIAEEFEFSPSVIDKLNDFFRMLGQSGTFLTSMTIRAQLEDLVALQEKQRIIAISDTIKSGWKSLKYSVEKVTKSEIADFDTSKPGSFKPKDPDNDNRWEKYKDDEVF